MSPLLQGQRSDDADAASCPTLELFRFRIVGMDLSGRRPESGQPWVRSPEATAIHGVRPQPTAPRRGASLSRCFQRDSSSHARSRRVNGQNHDGRHSTCAREQHNARITLSERGQILAKRLERRAVRECWEHKAYARKRPNNRTRDQKPLKKAHRIAIPRGLDTAARRALELRPLPPIQQDIDNGERERAKCVQAGPLRTRHPLRFRMTLVATRHHPAPLPSALKSIRSGCAAFAGRIRAPGPTNTPPAHGRGREGCLTDCVRPPVLLATGLLLDLELRIDDIIILRGLAGVAASDAGPAG